MNLGPTINSASGDLCANGTPDGKYFFFSSGRETSVAKGETARHTDVDYDLYWVATTSFAELEKKMKTARSAAKVIEKEYQTNGSRAAIDMLESLYSKEQDVYYFSAYELLSLCEPILSSGRLADAEELQRALAATLPSALRIKEGFAQICMMNGQVSKGMEILRELDSEDPSFDLKRTLPSFGYLLTQYPDKAEDALELLQLTVEMFPDSSFAYYSLARLYSDRGDTEKAIEACKKCLELEPNHGDAHTLLERLERQK
jgi:tetratricopeptide (TPR) repeat protein